MSLFVSKASKSCKDKDINLQSEAKSGNDFIAKPWHRIHLKHMATVILPREISGGLLYRPLLITPQY